MLKRTAHVVGTRTLGNGDPSPSTAYGVFIGLKAAVAYKHNTNDLKGFKVAIQGLGHVGMSLCQMLSKAGAEIFVTDLSEDAIKYAQENYNAKPVAPQDIYALDVDIFAPCALGGIINDSTIDKIKAHIISGASNNQLAEAYHGDKLAQRGVLYAPDYVINAGGLINVYYERQGYNREKAYNHINRISDTLKEIFDYAQDHQMSTARAADEIAEKRFQKFKD